MNNSNQQIDKIRNQRDENLVDFETLSLAVNSYNFDTKKFETNRYYNEIGDLYWKKVLVEEEDFDATISPIDIIKEFDEVSKQTFYNAITWDDLFNFFRKYEYISISMEACLQNTKIYTWSIHDLGRSHPMMIHRFKAPIILDLEDKQIIAKKILKHLNNINYGKREYNI